MGIQTPNNFLWRTNDIPWKVQNNGGPNANAISKDSYPVIELLKTIHSTRIDDGVIVRENPGVAFDANAIGYKYKHRAAIAVRECAQSFVQKGIDVTIVFDSERRHQSKRDAINRRATRAKQQVELVELRSQLLAIGVGPNALDEDVAKAEDIGSKIRRLENAASAGLPPDFPSHVKSQLESICNQFSGTIKFIEAPYQADPSIARLALTREVEAIVTTDSDFAMYVGPGLDGVSDVMLKPDIASGTLRACQISTSQSTCRDFLEKQGHSWSNQPKHPFFDGLKDCRVRALIAVALGCDANPGGVHGLGPAKLKDLTSIQSTFDGLVSELVKLGCKKKDCTERHSHISSQEALTCIVDSLAYETTHAGPLHSEPTELSRYNFDFAYCGTAEVEGPPLTTCHGCPGQSTSHDFISEEGVFKCGSCEQDHCRFCICKNGFCVSCSYDKLAGCQIDKTQQEMKDYLTSKKHVIPANIGYRDLAGMYLDELDQTLSHFDDAIEKVSNPILTTEHLKSENLNSEDSRLKLIAQSTMKDVSSLLGMESLSVRQKVQFIGLLADLTRFSSRTKGILKSEHVIPTCVLGMIDNSRIHDGGRLKARAIRHTMDVQTPKLIDAEKFSLATLDNETLCVVISGHKVKASMKPSLYKVMTAFNHKDLVACSCDCKAGCKTTNLESQRIVCTHSVTPMVQLSRLLHSGLAEHILIELRTLLERDDFTSKNSNNKLGRDESKAFTADVKSLIAAADKPGRPTPLIGTQNVISMLESFAVGTSKSKDTDLPMPNPSSMGLYRVKGKPQRPVLKLEKEMAKQIPEQTDTQFNLKPKCLSHNDLVEYSYNIKVTLDALDVVFNTNYSNLLGKRAEHTPIGHKLLRHRANKKGNSIDFVDHNKAVLAVTPGLTSALTGATVRGSKFVKKRKPEPEPEAPVKKRCLNPAKRVRKCCIVEHCNNSGITRVPPMPPPLKITGKESESAMNKKHRTYARKKFIREEWLDRLGLGRKYKHPNAELRHCGCHPIVQVTNKYTTCMTAKGEKQSMKLEPFDCIDGHGILSSCAPAKSESSGVGRDRWTNRYAQTLDENAKLVSVVLDELDNQSPIKPKKLPTSEVPVHTVESLTSETVKLMTGFNDLKALLKMAAVYSNGEIEVMTKTISKLTWVEEWVFYFSFVYGRSAIRWEDHELKWNSNDDSLRLVLREKLKLVIETRNKWPAYATFEEDVLFRDRSWDLHFDPVNGPRVVMHDGSNIPDRQPTDAELNRATHSLYYKMNCAKMLVSNQLCSWIRTPPSVTGRSGDGEMVDTTEVLELQQEFSAWDPSNKKEFTNIFDKGFRCTIAARNAGGQKVLQPSFARSDEQFTRAETLHSAAVAVVRSGNERAVNRVKWSWFILRGRSLQSWDVALVDDILMAWSFQVNFMYDSFL